MKNFKQVLKKVNVIVDEVLIFDVILNSVLIFLAFYLVFMLINVNPWYALFPTLAYFIFLLSVDVSRNKYKMVENKYAPLYEKLRTSADNIDKENEIVEELQKEVVSDLHNVKVSSFVKKRRISTKIFACILLCFIILLFAMYNIKIGNFDVTLNKVRNLVYGEGSSGGGEGGDELTAGAGEGDEDIYGEEYIAKLGSKELKIKIKTATFEVVGEVEEAPEREFEETFPDEIFAVAAGSYEEKIAIENQKLVKEYFKELSRG